MDARIGELRVECEAPEDDEIIRADLNLREMPPTTRH